MAEGTVGIGDVCGGTGLYQLSLYLISAVTHTAKGREGKGYLCCFFLKDKQKARLGEMKI